MWFKNLLIYRLEQAWSMTAGELEEKLAARPLTPCSAMSTESRGWVSPTDDGVLVPGVERHLLIALGIEQKLLPAAVVNAAVKERAAEFEREKGFAPGRKQLRDFKEIIAAELLPRAFAKRSMVRAWIDPTAGLLIVDSTSAGKAEQLVEFLRETLGELSVSLPQTEISPGVSLTHWLQWRKAPGHFDLGEECTLTSGDAAKSTVKYSRHNLDVQQIQRHLEEGLRVSKLAMTWNGRLSLVVDDKLQVSRLKFMEMDEVAEDPGLDAARQFEAEFTLMTGQIAPMIADLFEAVGAAAQKPDTLEKLNAALVAAVPGCEDIAYDQAVKVARETGKASISWIQRRLRIGYNQAARLVERMESEGVVGPSGVGGEREVFKVAA